MYDTEIPALRDQQESSVDAWMRAAAYAAGTEPDDDYFVVTEPDNEYFVATAKRLSVGANRPRDCSQSLA